MGLSIRWSVISDRPKWPEEHAKMALDGEGLEEGGIQLDWIPKADESYYRELMKLW